jgi:PAS domain S-box-containing protein
MSIARSTLPTPGSRRVAAFPPAPLPPGGLAGLDNRGTDLTTVAASPSQRHVALAVIAVSVVVFIALAPFAKVRLTPLPPFIPAYEATLVIIDLITAVLLLAQLNQRRSEALLALAAGYLFDALMIVPHALSFPGLLSPTGWIGGGAQTTAWLYMFWHGGFPLFVIAYCWLSRSPEVSDRLRSASIIAVVIGVAALVTALTLLATDDQGMLPAIMAGNSYTPAMKFAVGGVWLLTAAGLAALLLERPYSVLNLWLIVVMTAWLADIALSAVFNGGRFDLGFYAGRLYGAAATSFVLVVVLVEVGWLHRRLAQLTEILEEQNAMLDARVHEQTVQLLQINRQLGAILEASPVAIFMLDADGTVLQWTVSAERLFGYTREQAIGRLPPYLEEGDLENFRANLARASSGSRPTGSFETRRRRVDGAIIDVSIRWARVYDETGVMIGIMHAVADITERKKLESQLRQAQKMEALGNLTGGMAHDFNNHLGVIILNLDVLLEELSGEAEEIASEALAAATRGTDLIRRLLAFARRQPLQQQRCDINQLVSETTKLLERTLGEHVKITLSLEPGLWPSIVDPAQLEASLTNLANNARDAMPRGGELRIATGNRYLDADYAAQHNEVMPGNYAMIEISDTGSGIPPEMLSQVFEPFFTTKPPGKGTGLGLSMVYGFMKQSGGHINIYSEVGVGTTIRLYLPGSNADAQAAGEGTTPAASRGQGQIVLAVEDNPGLRRVVVRQLSELGYRVVEAENGKVAIEVLEHQQIDLLFTDVVLPEGVSGYDLAHEVATRWPAVKIVLTSGFPETRLLDEGAQPNVVKVLSKPYRRDDIARVMQEALQETRQPARF